MRGKIIRKILLVLIIVVPVFSYSDCKKQPKCGCGKDIIFEIVDEQVAVYFNSTGTTITFTRSSDPYSTYYFCNPVEMFPNLANNKTGDELELSGHVYWDCSYVYQSSNSTYQNPYKVYQVEVTSLTTNLYGK